MRCITVLDLMKTSGMALPKVQSLKEPSEAPSIGESKGPRGGFGVPRGPRNVVPPPAGTADSSAATPATKPLPPPKQNPKPVIDVLHGHGSTKEAFSGLEVLLALLAASGKPAAAAAGGALGAEILARLQKGILPQPIYKRVLAKIPGGLAGLGVGGIGAGIGAGLGAEIEGHALRSKTATVRYLLAKTALMPPPAAPAVSPKKHPFGASPFAAKPTGEDPFAPGGSYERSRTTAGDQPAGPSIIAAGSHQEGKNIVRDKPKATGTDPFASDKNFGKKTPEQQKRWASFEQGVTGGRQARATGQPINPLQGTPQRQSDVAKGINIGHGSDFTPSLSGGKPGPALAGPAFPSRPAAAQPIAPMPDRSFMKTQISGGAPTPSNSPPPASRPSSLGQGKLMDPFKTASWSKMGLHKTADKIDEELHRQGQWMDLPPAQRRAAHPDWKGLSLGDTAAKGRSAPATPPAAWSPGKSEPSTAPKPLTSFGAPQTETIRKAQGVSGGGSKNVQESQKDVGNFMGHGRMSHAVTGKGGSGWS